MFTGIIEELGEVTGVEDLGDSSRFTLRGPLVTEGARHVDSIADQSCLDIPRSQFAAEVAFWRDLTGWVASEVSDDDEFLLIESIVMNVALRKHVLQHGAAGAMWKIA